MSNKSLFFESDQLEKNLRSQNKMFHHSYKILYEMILKGKTFGDQHT